MGIVSFLFILLKEDEDIRVSHSFRIDGFLQDCKLQVNHGFSNVHTDFFLKLQQDLRFKWPFVHFSFYGLFA